MSLSMFVPTEFASNVLDTVVGYLAPLFLTEAEDDPRAARDSVSHLLAAYEAETDEELRLAAAVVSFGFHALEALSQATAPDLPLSKILRLRGSAVSLNREAHRSQRKLDQLQRDRRERVAAVVAVSEQEPPAVDAQPTRIPERVQATSEAGGFGGAEAGAASWTLSHKQRRAARHIAETFRRKHAEFIRREDIDEPPLSPTGGLAGETALYSQSLPAFTSGSQPVG